MFKKKHVVFHTDAPLDVASSLLRSKTEAGSPSADDMVAMLKDTLGTHAAPFRGEVAGPSFKLTRKVRGRRVRIAVEGSLKEKPGGGTEIHAAMAPPRSLIFGLFAGLLALLIISGGMALAGGQLWIPLLLLLMQVPVVALSSKLYERETSATFSALRDAVPEHVPAAVVPVGGEQTPDAAREAEKVPQGA